MVIIILFHIDISYPKLFGSNTKININCNVILTFWNYHLENVIKVKQIELVTTVT